jgi:two-component system, chemotaxis family, sensor kinase CheA
VKGMSDPNFLSKEPMLEMFIFESLQLIEQLEKMFLESEKRNTLDKEEINEIFRIMHTIKGSSAMMMFVGISSLTHSLEDLFYFMREYSADQVDFTRVCDLVLAAVDCIKADISMIEEGNTPESGHGELENRIKEYLNSLKGENEEKPGENNSADMLKKDQGKFYISTYGSKSGMAYKKYIARIYFEEGCQMENIRAYTIVHNLKDDCREIYHKPSDIVNDNTSSEYICKNGFTLYFSAGCGEETVRERIEDTLFLKSFELKEVDSYEEDISNLKGNIVNESSNVIDKMDSSNTSEQSEKETSSKGLKQSLISVSIDKLDKLMDLVGEIVISEAMVIRNPELKNLQLDSFSKAARQLRKLTDELQDVVMSIRMIPIAATFQKMNRIVRDMGKKLGKEVELKVSGEETEVDKNIIDHLSDPLMHLIRNAMDHGLEMPDERAAKGKPARGRISLEAKNAGGEVLITIIDDGRGLDKNRILEKARESGLINRPENELSDREIYSYVLLPGFSTKEKVTEFSGRGVGMDVVRKNIEKVGGSVSIESTAGIGTTITVKIPLTLAIIDGMEIFVGTSFYTIPMTAIKESFKVNGKDLINDPDGNEMIMIRGECHPIIRLHKLFGVQTEVEDLCSGIIVMVENDTHAACLFADGLIGEQQVVVKPLPNYILKYFRNVKGIGGCTILGDGNISLIIDVNGIIKNY